MFTPLGSRRVLAQCVFDALNDSRGDQHDERECNRHACANSHATFARSCGSVRANPLHQSALRHGCAQIDLDRPKKNPRLGPHCGAPTPTPVPLRISYFSSKRLITSKRAVKPFTSATSKL